jgi:flagellin
LSSGLRINSAKDDASGLAIAEGLTTKIRGNQQAVRNAGDGISLGQTAETALGQVASYLQRAREIAIQSANGAIGDTNRTQLQKEVDQLTQEISRIVQTTEFNGTALLSASSSLTFQVGYDGVSSNQVSVATTDLTGLQGPASTLYQGVEITGYAQAAAADDGIKDLAINGVAIKGPDISGVYERFNPDSSALERATELTAAINSFTGSTGVRAELNSTNDGVNLISDTGTDIIVASDTQSASDIRNWFGLELGTYTSTTNPGTPSVLTSYNSSLTATSTIDVSTQNGAQAALSSLDADISSITNTRASFGALQNRFEAVIANLQANEESYTAARSRILDADFATETANLTRNQILQQAGVSILSQANSLPQVALSLLS